MARVPRRFGDGRRDRERRAVARLRIVVGEVVDQLLDADRILRRQLALVQEAPDVGVRRGVDVDRERRQRLVGRAGPLVVVDPVVGLGVEWLARHSIRPGKAIHTGVTAGLPLLCVDHRSRAADRNRLLERAHDQSHRQLTGRSCFDQCGQGCGPKAAQLSLDCVSAWGNIHEFECTLRVSDPLLNFDRVASQGDRDPRENCTRVVANNSLDPPSAGLCPCCGDDRETDRDGDYETEGPAHMCPPGKRRWQRL